jgi:hypothetical protein
MEARLTFERGKAMAVSCEEVWQEISNYLEGDVSPILRAAMEEHFRVCKRCTAILDGTRNVVQLYGDERMFEVPLGFSHRLHQKLDESISGGRRRFLGWIVAAAAAVLVGASLEAARSFASGQPELRSKHAQSGRGIPPEMVVVVAVDGKIFHVPGCAYIQSKAGVRTLTAREAFRDGCTPCVRCLREYLSAALPSRGAWEMGNS